MLISHFLSLLISLQCCLNEWKTKNEYRSLGQITQINLWEDYRGGRAHSSWLQAHSPQSSKLGEDEEETKISEFKFHVAIDEDDKGIERPEPDYKTLADLGQRKGFGKFRT